MLFFYGASLLGVPLPLPSRTFYIRSMNSGVVSRLDGGRSLVLFPLLPQLNGFPSCEANDLLVMCVCGGGGTNVCIGFRVFDSAAFKKATGMSSSRDAVPDFFQLTSWCSSVKFLSLIAAIEISKKNFEINQKLEWSEVKSKNETSKETEFKKENLQEIFFFFFLILKKKIL